MKLNTDVKVIFNQKDKVREINSHSERGVAGSQTLLCGLLTLQQHSDVQIRTIERYHKLVLSNYVPIFSFINYYIATPLITIFLKHKKRWQPPYTPLAIITSWSLHFACPKLNRNVQSVPPRPLRVNAH